LQETLENVKKCKNFLVTLIKLASSGTHSAEMAKNVKELVKNLLDGKIEPEEFTDRLYTELKSSPQPYLVPFLKRSLPAVRQLTPNSQLFIQQCVVPKPQAAGSVSTAAVTSQQAVKPTPANSKTIQPNSVITQPVKPASPDQAILYDLYKFRMHIILFGSKKGFDTLRRGNSYLSGLYVSDITYIHTQRNAELFFMLNSNCSVARKLPEINSIFGIGIFECVFNLNLVVIKQSVTTVPSLLTTTLQNRFPQNRPLTTTLHTGLHSIGTILRQPPPQGHKFISVQTPLVHRSNFKENAAAAFRDEDDINDVASMAGVNLSEENARILATNSELVGSVIRSCRDEPFILTATLQKIILEIGKRHGVTDVSSDVVNLVSHATQERLRELIEKLTVVAHHRKISYKDSDHYTHCNETRLQLKFLEQLDRLEKQRKDEEEREMLLRAAKSRANKEDPEQLRLKQKAKEMQQLEMAQMQQRDANLTALAAIGPRKKRPLDSLGYGSGSEVENVFTLTVFIMQVCFSEKLICMFLFVYFIHCRTFGEHYF
ncbi:TAF4B factor, partial [Amia calva]|nr:TAF4B factor [Amia calva]